MNSAVAAIILGLLIVSVVVVATFLAGRYSALSQIHQEHEQQMKELMPRLSETEKAAEQFKQDIEVNFQSRKALTFRERIKLIFGD